MKILDSARVGLEVAVAQIESAEGRIETTRKIEEEDKFAYLNHMEIRRMNIERNVVDLWRRIDKVNARKVR